MFQARVFEDPLPPRVARNKAPEACPVLCLHLLHNQANLERVIIRVAGMSKPTVSSSTPTSTTFGPTSLRKAKKALMATSSETHSTRATCFTNTVGRKRKVDEPPSLVKKCFRGIRWMWITLCSTWSCSASAARRWTSCSCQGSRSVLCICLCISSFKDNFLT